MTSRPAMCSHIRSGRVAVLRWMELWRHADEPFKDVIFSPVKAARERRHES